MTVRASVSLVRGRVRAGSGPIRLDEFNVSPPEYLEGHSGSWSPEMCVAGSWVVCFVVFAIVGAWNVESVTAAGSLMRRPPEVTAPQALWGERLAIVGCRIDEEGGGASKPRGRAIVVPGWPCRQTKQSLGTALLELRSDLSGVFVGVSRARPGSFGRGPAVPGSALRAPKSKRSALASKYMLVVGVTGPVTSRPRWSNPESCYTGGGDTIGAGIIECRPPSAAGWESNRMVISFRCNKGRGSGLSASCGSQIRCSRRSTRGRGSSTRKSLAPTQHNCIEKPEGVFSRRWRGRPRPGETRSTVCENRSAFCDYQLGPGASLGTFAIRLEVLLLGPTPRDFKTRPTTRFVHVCGETMRWNCRWHALGETQLRPRGCSVRKIGAMMVEFAISSIRVEPTSDGLPRSPGGGFCRLPAGGLWFGKGIRRLRL